MNGGLVMAEYLFAALPPPDFKVGGNFTCVASNQIGTTVRTAEVIVQRKSIPESIDESLVSVFSISRSCSNSYPYLFNYSEQTCGGNCHLGVQCEPGCHHCTGVHF